MNEPVKILILEDTAADVELAERGIKKILKSYTIIHVETREDYLSALDKFQPDLVISNYSLPGFNGMSALRLLRERSLPIPLIIFTGSMNEDIAVECMKAGATDYVVKGNMKRLGSAISRALEQKKIQIEKINAEEAIKESEGRYETLFNVAQEAIFIADVESGILLDCNESACALVGRTKKELIGKHQHFLHPPDERFDGYSVSFREHIMGEPERVLNGHVVTKSGIIKDVEIKANIHNMKGKKVIQGFFHDVTEHKRAEKALEESEEKYRSIVETTTEWIWEIDIAGKHTFSNQGVTAILGYRPEEFIGHSAFSFLHPEDRKKVQLKLPKLMVKKHGWREWILRWRHKDGSYRFLESNAVPIIDSAGNLQGYRGSDRDITERKRAEEALRESERRLSSLYDTVGNIIFHLAVEADGCYRFISVNPAFCKVTGLSKEKVVGKLVNNVIPEPSLSMVLEKYRQAIEENSIVRWEETSDYPTGQLIGDVSIAPVFDDKGRCTHLVGSVHDITERKQIEEKLTQERILLRTLIDNLPVGIYIKDINMRKVLVNTADLTFIGKPEAEVLGKDDSELFKPEIAAKFLADDKMVIEKGQAIINREELVLNDLGESRWLLTSKLPLRDHKGKITGLIGIGFDITGRKKTEELLKERELKLQEQNEEYQKLNLTYLAVNQELKESLKRIQVINKDLLAAKEKAEESDMLKSAFLANMSHEIRTPMNSIVGFSGLLTKRFITDEKRNEYVQIINSNCQQLLSIINDILDLSRIESGQFTISTDLIDIYDLVYQLYLEYSARKKGKEIKLSFKNEGTNTSLTFLSDVNRITQILSNLLSNAIKFTDTGTIEIGYDLKGKMIDFYIRDTGIGIAPEYHELIFERFRQVETSISRQYGGAGLGLSISKALAEILGGTLRVESELGKGSTFFLTMPYHKEKKTTKKSVSPLEIAEPVSLKGKTILIAEDEDLNYRYMSELLAETGANELHAWNGIEAVEKIKAHPEIDLVLMDIKMPFMDGYEASRLIKELHPELPIIAITAYAMSNDKERILQIGFTGYISKPFQIETFMEKISSILFGHTYKKNSAKKEK